MSTFLEPVQISKVHKFHNPEGFAKAYGLVEVVTSTVLIGLTIYGFIDYSRRRKNG